MYIFFNCQYVHNILKIIYILFLLFIHTTIIYDNICLNYISEVSVKSTPHFKEMLSMR